jgi:Sulfotransferase family
MIISHKHRFIFFAVPKTATHTIRQALSVHLGEGDWQQQILFGKDQLPIPALAAKEHGHLSVREVLPHLSADVWRSYFKFAIVRNPFDRFVSTCFFLFRREPEFAKAATAYMKRALDKPRFRRRALVVPQSSLLSGPDGDLQMDFIGRFEDLQASYKEVCQGIGITTIDLEKRNPSEHDQYAEYYDEQLKQMVTDFYRDDLSNFGYQFESAAPTN